MDEAQTRRRAHRWLAVLAAATVALARWAVLYVRYRESRRARLWGP